MCMGGVEVHLQLAMSLHEILAKDQIYPNHCDYTSIVVLIPVRYYVCLFKYECVL